MFPIFIHTHWISHTATSKTLSSFIIFFFITMTINFCMVYFYYKIHRCRQGWVLSVHIKSVAMFFHFFSTVCLYVHVQVGGIGGSRVTITMYRGLNGESRRRRRRRREVIFSRAVAAIDISRHLKLVATAKLVLTSFRIVELAHWLFSSSSSHSSLEKQFLNK